MLSYCQFLSILVNFGQFLSIWFNQSIPVNYYIFQSIPVNSCQILSVSVHFCHFPSRFRKISRSTRRTTTATFPFLGPLHFVTRFQQKFRDCISQSDNAHLITVSLCLQKEVSCFFYKSLRFRTYFLTLDYQI